MLLAIPIFLLLVKFLLLVYGLKINKSNLFFVGFLLTINLYFLSHIFWVELKDLELSLVFVNHFTPLYYLTGPFLYFYVKSINNGGYVANRYDLLHGIPFIIQLIAISPYLFTSVDNKILILNTLFVNPSSAVNLDFNFLFSPRGNFFFRFLSISIYLLLSFRIVIMDKYLRLYYRITYRWLLSILVVFSVLILSYLIIVVNFFKTPDNLFILLNSRIGIVTLFMLTVIAMLPLFFPHILYGNSIIKRLEKKLKPDQKLETLPNKSLILLSQKILSYFEENEHYLKPNFKLPDLAKDMCVPVHHIQKCFQEVHKTTFVNFKTTYKIKWAIKALKNPAFKNDTIESVGGYSGFKSKSQFYIAFKKHTGLTPSKYLKKHRGKSI